METSKPQETAKPHVTIFTNFCKYCGKEIHKKSTQCQPCYFKHKKAPWLKKFQFKKGHKSWIKGKHIQTNTGRTHFRKGHKMGWKGGRVKMAHGYIIVYKPSHPNAMKKKYVLEHRLLMEKYLGRYLSKDEVVHHKNKKVWDNRIENLGLFPDNGEHLREELTGTKRLYYGQKT